MTRPTRTTEPTGCALLVSAGDQAVVIIYGVAGLTSKLSRASLQSLRVAIGFALAIGLGSILLQLPGTTRQKPLPAIDAIFLSTSAVCVTGLTPVSVGERLTRSGQAILVGLIQLGGLGISTVSTVLILLAGRVTLSHRVAAEETLAAVRAKPMRLLGLVVLMTITAECAGAVILAGRFDGPEAAWLGFFHSVSAFCNAGFALYPDSLETFRSDPLVNSTVAALIMTGGLGFVVAYQIVWWLFNRVRGSAVRLPLHARVVLSTNVLLWFAGGALFLAVERDHAIRGMSLISQLTAAGFQSVTARTAGFDTINVDNWREFTRYCFMFLMLIGASPGSCGGGMKVTTVAVILATIRARLRGRTSLALFDRSLAPELAQRSFLILSLSLLFLSMMVGALLLFEGNGQSDALSSLAFEVVSAYGTVGLSTGVTPTLSNAGKIVIIVCMFVGRLGPLSVALAVIRRRDEPQFEYPQEPLAIG